MGVPDYARVPEAEGEPDNIEKDGKSRLGTAGAGPDERRLEAMESEPFELQSSARLTIASRYKRVMLFGVVRWAMSIILLAGSACALRINAIPKVVPLAAYNIACAGTHFILIQPRLRSTASPTSTRPSTLWLLQFCFLFIISLGSVGVSIYMLTVTYPFRAERDPDGSLCHNKHGGYHRCFSDRSSTHDTAAASLSGAILTFAAMLGQLWHICQVNKSAYTARQIKGHYDYVNNMERKTNARAEANEVWKGVKAIPSVFMDGIQQGRRSH